MKIKNIKEFLDQDERKDLLRFLTAGSVDDGKSTLIGRLLFDSKKIYEDQLQALERDSKRVGNAGEHIDYALLLDGLKAEREEGITIDVAYRYFSTNQRKFIIADTPGHEQYTRNMITGGSTANLAIILVDARLGIITQTRRHSYLVALLGIKHIVLAVNKMDLVDFDEKTFSDIAGEYTKLAHSLGVDDVTCIPLSALDGDNVVEKSSRTPWYKGTSLLNYLETVPIDLDRNMTDFRYPVQYVLRPNLNFRGFSAKIASGVIHQGDEVLALPSNKTTRIKNIVTYDGNLDEAFCPQCVTLTLEDEIDISRGEMLVHPDNLPEIGRHFEAMFVWMDEEPLDTGKQFYLKQTTNLTRATIDKIQYQVDVNTYEHRKADGFKLNEIGKVNITTAKELFFDSYKKNKATGSFILIDPITNNTSAVGMIICPTDTKDINEEEMPELNLPRLGIDPEHYDAIDRAVRDLSRQGIAVNVIKEK
jgi:sulfate adenylyltransferase subunit 1